MNHEQLSRVMHEAKMYPYYMLDINVLSATLMRIVIATGQASHRHSLIGCGAILQAERPGKYVVEFPIHNASYVSHQRAIAEQLRQVLNKNRQHQR